MRTALLCSLRLMFAVLIFPGLLFSQTPSDLVSKITLLNRSVETHPQLSRPSRTVSPDLQALLEARQKLVEELIRTNPAAVRSVILPEDVAQQLSAASPVYAAAIETADHWSGTLEGTIADDFEHGRSVTHWYVHSGDQRLELFFVNDEHPFQKSRRNVIVEGIGTSRVVSVDAMRLAHPEAQAPTGLNCNPTGSESVAVLIMKQPNGGTTYPDPAFATSAYWQPIYFGASAPSVNHFWGETSFSTTSASGSFFGPFTFDANYDCNNTDQIVASAISAAKASGQDLSTFSRISIIYPVAACGFGGLGDVGCRAADSNLNHPYSITWIPVISYYTTSQVLWGLIAHELGHNLGLNHSSSLDFGSLPLGAVDYTQDQNSNDQGNAGTGVQIEYGDPYTMMGGGTYSCFGQYTAFNKCEYLTWMSRTADTHEITTTGGSFKVVPYENSTGLRALRILRDPLSSSWVWVEYRQPLGNYDSLLSNFQCQGGSTNILSGGTVYYESPYSEDGHLFLLDMNPTSSPNDYTNAALTPGHSWSDPFSLLTLSVTNADGTGLSINAGYDAPCASLQISNGGVFSSGTSSGTITVTAPSNCSWTASTVDSWIAINSGSSGTGNGTVGFTVGANGSFQRAGYITVQRQSVPLSQKGSSTFISNLSPTMQSGLSGVPVFTFNDPAGTADINYVTVKFHDNGCEVETVQGTPSGNWFMFLLDPATNTFSNAIQPGQNLTASNANCTLNGLTSTVSMNGNQFQLGLSLTFAQSFVGSYRVTGSVCDGGGGNNCSSDISIGTWQVGSFGQVQLSPTSLTFSPQNPYTISSSKPVTLTNIGNATLHISSITASSEFGVTHNCPSSLAVNGTCTLNVTFQPIHVGTRMGTVTIVDDAPSSPQTISLSGYGNFVMPLSRPGRGARPPAIPLGLVTHLQMKLSTVDFADPAALSCSAPKTLFCSITGSSPTSLTVAVDSTKARPGRYLLTIVEPQTESTVATVPVVVKAKPRRKPRKP